MTEYKGLKLPIDLERKKQSYVFNTFDHFKVLSFKWKSLFTWLHGLEKIFLDQEVPYFLSKDWSSSKLCPVSSSKINTAK